MDGISAKSSGYISSLPRSIVAESTIFENAEYPENEPIGPTAPNPGPIWLYHAATAVKFVSKSNGSRQRRRNTAKYITIYSAK